MKPKLVLIQSLAAAVLCDKTNPLLQGTLTKVEYNRGTKKNSTIYHLEKSNGESLAVWGGASIDGALLKKGRINPEYMGRFVQFKFIKEAKAKKGQNPWRVIEVRVDMSARKGKIYRLKP